MTLCAVYQFDVRVMVCKSWTSATLHPKNGESSHGMTVVSQPLVIGLWVTGRTEGLQNGMSDILRRAHFTAQARCFMTLVHLWVTMFHVIFWEKSVGKVNLLRTSCVSAFSRFSLFWRVWSVHMSSCHSHVHFSTLKP